MKAIHIQYFALLREQRGLSAEIIHTNAADPAELYREVSARYMFSLPAERLRVAVDDEFVAWTIPLVDGARVMFIPPVAGG